MGMVEEKDETVWFHEHTLPYQNQNLDWKLSSSRYGHGLSQQGIWASFGHPNPQRYPLRTPKLISQNVNFKLRVDIQLSIIPITLYKNIMSITSRCKYMFMAAVGGVCCRCQTSMQGRIEEETVWFDKHALPTGFTMVLASRASGCLFGHPNPLKSKYFCEEFLKMPISSI